MVTYVVGIWWHTGRGLHSSSVTSVRVPSGRTSTQEMHLTITISSLSAPMLQVCTPWLWLRYRLVCMEREFWPAPLNPVDMAISMVSSLNSITGEVATVRSDGVGMEEVAIGWWCWVQCPWEVISLVLGEEWGRWRALLVGGSETREDLLPATDRMALAGVKWQQLLLESWGHILLNLDGNFSHKVWVAIANMPV